VSTSGGEWDSFFEVVDALTGTSLGGFLVQFGGGPASFDSAFSCGDTVFLSKDQMRLTVFELHDGKMLARLRGQHPAASAAFPTALPTLTFPKRGIAFWS
jgi:hypothetical protein